MTVINTVIFDMAGVLLPTLSQEIYPKLESDHGLPTCSILELCKDSQIRALYQHVERGRMSCAEFETIFVEKFREQHQLSDKHSFSPFLSAEDAYTARDMVFPGMAALVRRLKAVDYTTALITNNYFLDHEKTKSALYVQRHQEYFDHIFESCRLGQAKPDSTILSIALEKMGKRAEECVFLDDGERNLIPAQKLGMKTIWVQTTAQAIDDLEKLLGQDLH